MTEQKRHIAPMVWAPEIWLDALNGQVHGAAPGVVNYISTDTRALQAGDMFVALRGLNFDGHAFLNQAIDAGATTLVVDDNAYSRDVIAVLPKGVTIVVVADTLTALGDLARAWRLEQPCFVTCITGSSGKTTTKDMTASIMTRAFKATATKGNLNNLIGVPLTVLDIRDEDIAVIELGMNVPGEIKRLAEITTPDSGVITAIHPAHLEGMGTIDAVADAKMELFKAIEEQGGTVAWNMDDPAIVAKMNSLAVEGFTFGLENADVDISADNIVIDTKSSSFTLRIWDETSAVRIPMPGRHAVSDALAAAALATIHGVDIETISKGLKAVTVTPGRLRRLDDYTDIDVFDDTYNANPASMKAALDVLDSAAAGHRRIAVLGTMLELGDTSKALHTEVGAYAADRSDIVVAFGPQAGDITTGVSANNGKGFAFQDMSELVEFLKNTVRANDAILLKGSRGMQIERAMAGLTAFRVNNEERKA